MPEAPVDPQDNDTAAEDHGVRSAAVLMITTIALAALTGVVRDAAIAKEFGVGLEASAYFQAFRIPSFVYFLIAGGALRTGFIPVFAAFRQRGESDKAWRTFSALLTVLLVVAVLVVALGMLLASPLSRLIAPGLEQEGQALCARLMRIMFPAQIFFVVGGLLMGTLNAMRHFWGPAIGPILYNVAIIIAALVFTQRYGIYALAVAAVVGAFFNTMPTCIPPLVRLGARFRPIFDLGDEGLRRVVVLAAPIILGLAIAEINLLITSALATSVGEWGAAVLNNADRLAKLPMRMFGAGIAIAVFPTLAIHAAAEERERFSQVLSSSLRNVMFLAVPAAAGIVVLRTPIIRLIFERGQFTAEDTERVAVTTAYLAVSILSMAALQIVARAFYALQDTRTPVMVGAGAVAICVTLSLILVRPLGVAGLGLAISVSALFNVGLLAWVLRRRMGLMDGQRMAATFGKVAAASLIMAFVAWLTALVAQGGLGTSSFGSRLAVVLVAAGVGALIYWGAALLFRIEEAHKAMALVTRRFRKTVVSGQ